MAKTAPLEVICGGMYSGKTEELIRRLKRGTYARQRVVAFKPTIDNRYSQSEIASHTDERWKCFPVLNADDILSLVRPDDELIGIDEVQFFDRKIVDVCLALTKSGKRVIAAGLDLDSQERPFGHMPSLLALAEEVTKLHAVCVACGARASRSQRIISLEDQVVVGSEGVYEARCKDHFSIVPIRTQERIRELV